ncbi:Thermostable monoacylglycerol lipase [Burkholderiales bacterium]|jgi:carboxylesterase|nr:Thermostable monoacylglycerol lipase [Burkholderiales bacterium]
MVEVMKGAEPFAFEGNDIGVLVLHGFTGCPQSMRYVGEELHRRFGFTIVGPRLPGHGTTPQDMATTSAKDWLGEAERALNELAARKSKVFVTGLSMGGTITLNLAWRHKDKITGIATVAAAAGILSNGMADAMFLNPMPEFLGGIGSDIKKPGVVELAYADVPTACFGTLTNLIMGTATRLKEITCPTLVIHGREDHVVPAVNATIVTSGVSSDDVRLLWLNESYHVATLDNDKDVIVNSIGRFFNEIAEA